MCKLNECNVYRQMSSSNMLFSYRYSIYIHSLMGRSKVELVMGPIDCSCGWVGIQEGCGGGGGGNAQYLK